MGIEPTLLTSRTERPTADPIEGYLVIICHTGETNFRRPPLAQLSVDARSFARDTGGGRVGRPWDGRTAASGRVAVGSSRL